MFDLSGKGALVTGASGGIGAAIARTLNANGANVAVSGTRVERLEALAGELGERTHIVPADLSDGWTRWPSSEASPLAPKGDISVAMSANGGNAVVNRNA